jgi:hypothetical protein
VPRNINGTSPDSREHIIKLLTCMQVDTADSRVYTAMLLRASNRRNSHETGAVIKAMRGWETDAKPFSVDDVSLMRELATAAAQVRGTSPYCTRSICLMAWSQYVLMCTFDPWLLPGIE